MVMLIAGGSLSTGSHDPYCGTLMPLGPSTPSVGLEAWRPGCVHIRIVTSIRAPLRTFPPGQLPPNRSHNPFPSASIDRRVAAAKASGPVRGGGHRQSRPDHDEQELSRHRLG